MLMSIAAISAGVAGWPRLRLSAANAFADHASARATAVTAFRLRVHIRHLAVRRHAPGLDGVVVIRDVEPLVSDELAALGLHGAALIGGPTLEHGRRAVPAPGHAEAGERFRQHRLGQRRLAP